MNANGNCPICGLQCVIDGTYATNRVNCLRCGTYPIVELVSTLLQKNPLTPKQVANASGWIREHPDVVISQNEHSLLKTLQSPAVGDKATKLLVALAKLHPTPGEVIKLWNHDLPYIAEHLGRSPGTLDNWMDAVKQFLQLVGTAWIESKSEFKYVVDDYLCNARQYLVSTGDHQWGHKITPDGWAYVDELQRVNSASRVGFIAMWFQKELDPLFAAIESGIRAAGYDPKRIDRVEHNNRIDDEIIAWIRRSKFVVADFTGNRGGVYFESGYALGMGLQVIWLCREEDLPSVHFDNRQYNFIAWSPDRLSELTERLQNRIEATIGRPA